MKIRNLTLLAVISVFALSAGAAAADLPALDTAAIRELTASMPLPAPEPSLAAAVLPAKGQDPVIITVPGIRFGGWARGPLEPGIYIRLFKRLFPDKRILEADLTDAFAAFNTDYFLPEDGGTDAALPGAADLREMPDNYIELKLLELPGYQAHNVIVRPFPWSRDPADTDTTVPRLERAIIETYDAYKATGRPIYILNHSWGSVLSHEALHRIARYRPDVRIDKLISSGSPLVPANFIIKLFMGFEITKEKIQKAVVKPANVGVWHNVWTANDPFANAIEAADANSQAGAQAEALEADLLDLVQNNKPLKKAARLDLLKVRNPRAWHASYFYDYRAALPSLNTELFVPVFRQQLAPQVADWK